MKKLIFGMLVAVTAAGGSIATYASTLVKGQGKLEAQWFRYHGGDINDPSNYTATTSLPQECDGGQVRCAILAEPNPSNPNNPVPGTPQDVAFKSN